MSLIPTKDDEIRSLQKAVEHLNSFWEQVVELTTYHSLFETLASQVKEYLTYIESNNTSFEELDKIQNLQKKMRKTSDKIDKEREKATQKLALKFEEIQKAHDKEKSRSLQNL